MNGKKFCPNESCERHLKKRLYSASDEFCSKCGTPLVVAPAKLENGVKKAALKGVDFAKKNGPVVKQKVVAISKNKKVRKVAKIAAIEVVDLARKQIKNGNVKKVAGAVIKVIK